MSDNLPNPTPTQDNFDVKLMEGTFYELAYHDYTQPRNLCGCERSVKTIDTATGRTKK